MRAAARELEAGGIVGQTVITVVIPCYRSERTIGKVVSLTRDALISMGFEYEFVLVNDASPDGTFDSIRTLCSEDPRIVGVNLARNFGQHSAIMAGLRYVHGDYVMLMDDDMQTHPSQCKKLIDKMTEGNDVVFATFPDHKEAWWRRVGSRFQQWTVRVLTSRPRGVESSNFFIMKRLVSDEITKYTGPYVYIQGLIFQVTSDIVNVPVEHFEREEGSSGYSLKALLRLWSVILNFSMAPLRMAAVIGAVMGILGLIGAVVLIVQRVLDPTMVAGWSSLMVALMICSGFILMFLGLIGEYLGRLFMTINKTPQFVLREVLNGEEGDTND
ncbi:MAG: glycosyltransferase family 2 protein [Atopobiaceae bacterium]|jgi:undecaprenyl-phosphate 4-deoxy-4-formamido-L-arabinose transferase|nr:glycosyltransferase family 2 protein [Atopobiaceae bacterium]MCI2173734.1 glycosyltransferase family 2 protein [Atopobiaceae bacterium]MCI2207624.1 glycosyltransferase family 2 protein [Atopobiaceae bacterium]